MVIHIFDGHGSRVQSCALLYEDESPACQKFAGTLHMCTRGMRESNQIVHSDQTILEENLYGADHSTCHYHKF